MIVGSGVVAGRLVEKMRTQDQYGILPIGLFYHAAYTLAASLLLSGLVRRYWPAHLEDPSMPRAPEGRADHSHPTTNVRHGATHE